MAIQPINIGNLVNDGLGDDLRTAFQKVNANFADLSSSLTVTASNAAGNVGHGIFAQKINADLQFKNLIAGNKIQLTSFLDSIRIDFTTADAFARITTDDGIINGSAFNQISILGTDNINVTATGSTIVVDTPIAVTDILTSCDFGEIGDLVTNAVQFMFLTTSIDLGSISAPSTYYFDFGSI